MKKFLIFAVTIMIVAGGSSPYKKTLTLKGEYPSASDGTMIWLKDRWDFADSTVVKNGKFEFTLKNAEPDEYVVSRTGADGGMEMMMVFLDDYDTRVTLSDDTYKTFGNTMIIRSTVTGNPVDAAARELNDTFFGEKPAIPPTEKLEAVAARGDMASVVSLKKFMSIYVQGIAHEKLLEFVSGLSDEIKQTKTGRWVVENYAPVFAMMTGRIAPDFTMQTPDGKSITLSEYVKGKKAVLIDFWASWCGPCRDENPKVKVVYEQFRNRGFDILGVSLDDDAKAWKQAIEDDGLVWNHVSELRKWQSEVVKTYNFNGVPHFVLLDGDMRILAAGQGLRQNLEETVAKYCGR